MHICLIENLLLKGQNAEWHDKKYSNYEESDQRKVTDTPSGYTIHGRELLFLMGGYCNSLSCHVTIGSAPAICDYGGREV